jgi:ATP-dependent Lon protease
VKEKVLAAHRAGIRTVVIPKANEPQLVADVSEELRAKMRIVLAERIPEVLDVALKRRRARQVAAVA